MKTRNIALACLIALSGTAAFAAGPMPAAGEGPLFNDQPVLSSTVSRDSVRAAAARTMPATGEQTALTQTADTPSTLTRADVRAETRNAIARGYHVPAGDLS